ncbi:MAG: hypothetical protein JWP52_2339, partial [Rhizobacter sp.]|nr:hypothetical protein [Rhizobacter sp.]
MNVGSALRLRILAVGVVLILAFVGAAAYDGWRLHQQLVTSNERELGNLAKALAEEASRSLEAVDVVLRDTADWYETTGRSLPEDSVQSALNARAMGVTQVSVVTIVDAQGRQRLRSRQTGEPLADVSDRPYFQTQRDSPGAGLVINAPIVTRSERMASMVVSRRLNDRHGNFDGVVSAIVTLQHLQSAYSALVLSEGSALLLTLDDGTLVVRQPMIPGPDAIFKFPELAALKGGALVDRAVSPMDGRIKLVAAVGVGHQPLILAMMRDEERALAPWVDEMRSAIVRTVLLSLLVMLTI